MLQQVTIMFDAIRRLATAPPHRVRLWLIFAAFHSKYLEPVKRKAASREVLAPHPLWPMVVKGCTGMSLSHGSSPCCSGRLRSIGRQEIEVALAGWRVVPSLAMKC